MKRRLILTAFLVAGLWKKGASQAPRDGSLRQTSPFANFVDRAWQAGLRAETTIGERDVKRYILESTGAAVALIDADGDGWLDIFLTNGDRLNGGDPKKRPSNHFYRNRRDGTFEDRTETAGLSRSGWAQGACVGDFDGDRRRDLFVTYWGQNVLYKNRGGVFSDATKQAGLDTTEKRWGAGCALVDYDRDGDLDLFVANYVDYADGLSELPDADQVCRWKGLRVFCGPKGLRGSRPVLYRNRGNGVFDDVSTTSRIADVPPGNGFTAITADFDNDGWPDIYVANDTAPSLLYHNQRDGTFKEIGWPSFTAVSADGIEQAGMGVDVADYDGDGLLDIVKTNFSNDIPTLYRNLGRNVFNDVALGSGLHVNRHHLGWGVVFADVDADTWPDVLIANGHVYPGIERVEYEATYEQTKLLYRNLGSGKFQDVTASAGPAVLEKRSARGLAMGDLFNRGQLDFVVNNMWDRPSLLSNTRPSANHWISVRLEGVRTNADGIGSRVRIRTGSRVQINEVRSGASFCSQNDLRLFFGLGEASAVDQLEVDWLGGATEKLRNITGDRFIAIREGKGLVESKPRQEMPRAK